MLRLVDVNIVSTSPIKQSASGGRPRYLPEYALDWSGVFRILLTVAAHRGRLNIFGIRKIHFAAVAAKSQNGSGENFYKNPVRTKKSRCDRTTRIRAPTIVPALRMRMRGTSCPVYVFPASYAKRLKRVGAGYV